MTLVNTQCRLAARPVGLPNISDWEIVEGPVESPADGEFLVRVEYVSVDPAMRTWMNAGRSYVPPVELGEVMRAGGVGRVVESRNANFAVGEEVYGVFGVQRYAVSDGRGLTRVDTAIAPAPVHLGVLGVSGLTAYFGLLDVGRPEPGQTVVVSGAAGSVGRLASKNLALDCGRLTLFGNPANPASMQKLKTLAGELYHDALLRLIAGSISGVVIRAQNSRDASKIEPSADRSASSIRVSASIRATTWASSPSREPKW